MLDRSLCLGMMARPSAELAITQSAHLATQRLPSDAEPELFPQPLAEIDQAPAHDAMDSRDRTALDHCRQRCAIFLDYAGLPPRRLAIDQAIRSFVVEPQHPVPNDLQTDIADPRSITATAAIIDRSQRQQPARLLRILGPACQPPQIRTSEVRPERYRCCHDEIPLFAMVKSHQPRVGEAL
jgi:hypothetical protein